MKPRNSRNTPRRTRSVFAAVMLFVVAAFVASPARATIRYTISLAHPEAHTFHVTMIVPDVRGPLSIQIPAWNATYMIRDFAWHVQGLRASAQSDKSLDSRKTDPLTWKITGNGEITIRYDTFWNETGPFAAQLN